MLEQGQHAVDIGTIFFSYCEDILSKLEQEEP